MFPCVDREPAGPGTQLNIHKGEGTGDVLGCAATHLKFDVKICEAKASELRSAAISDPPHTFWQSSSPHPWRNLEQHRAYWSGSSPRFHAQSPRSAQCVGRTKRSKVPPWSHGTAPCDLERFPGKSHKFQDVPRCSKYGFACLIPVRKLGDNRCGRKPFLIRDLFSLTTCTVEANNMAYSYTP